MIWHIFRKNLRISWKPALGAAILQWIATALIVKVGVFSGSLSLEEMRSVVRVAAGLATCVVAITAVHNDVLTLPTGDWLMRPIRRRDMLLAKMLFFMVAMQLPILIGCVGEGMAFGFGFGNALLAALWQSAMMTLGVGVTAVAVGAMTASLAEAIAFLVIAASIVAARTWLAATLSDSRSTSFALDWIEVTALTGGMFAAGAIALGVLYGWRKVMRARIASVTVFALGAACALLPWNTAFALQRWVTPSTGAASHIQLALDTAPRHHTVSYTDSAFFPVRAAGLEAGTELVTDRVQVKLIRPDGSVEYPAHWFTGDRNLLGIISGTDGTVTVDADYSLTLVRETGGAWVETGDRDTPVPALGRCRIQLASDNSGETVGCVSAGPINGVCYSAAGVATEPHCSDYAPKYLWSPNWDELQRLRSLYVPVHGVPRRVYVKTYKVVEHFFRHLEIPNVRLDDWRSR
jgi:hypothetical protein